MESNPHSAHHAPLAALSRLIPSLQPAMTSPNRKFTTQSNGDDSKHARGALARTSETMTAEHYIDAARSAATKKAYATDLAHFLANGGKLPAKPQELCAYLAKLAATLTVATIERRLIGIHRAHQDRKLTSPAVHVSVRQTMQGIRRTLGTAQRRVRAILKDDILEMLALIDQQKPVRAARDRALLLIGFAGAFRRSELVGIQHEDITVVDEGIEILLRRSKTDQEGNGRTVFIPHAKGARCPVAAIAQWAALSGIDSGFVFRRVTRHDTVGRHPLTGQSVALIIKTAYQRGGGNASLVAGHSLRAGYVTAAALAGLQPFHIQQQTGHRSTATLARYIRPIERRKIPTLL